MADKQQQAALISKNIKHMREVLGWTQSRVEFYRKWGDLDKLPEEDQQILRDMMERFTKK